MLDPFPLAPPSALVALVRPIASALNLTTLPYHAHELLAATLFYQLLGASISPWLSTRLFPRTYPGLDARTRLNWDVHVVSLVQSLLVSGLALWLMAVDEDWAAMNWKGRVWGYSGALGMLQALAAGYFLWDLVVSFAHRGAFGWGFVVHAFSALTVYMLGFVSFVSCVGRTRVFALRRRLLTTLSRQRPFVNHYAPIFVLYELSSPFLNIHWFLDKLALTGSNYQLVNGIALIATFFGCRLVYGTYQSVRVFTDVFRAVNHQWQPSAHAYHDPVTGTPKILDVGHEPRSELMRFAADESLPVWMGVSYLAANIALHVLNVYWFGKMIDAIRKRFDPPFGTRGTAEKCKQADGAVKKGGAGAHGAAVAGVAEDVQLARGVYADGRKTVEVEKRDVRSRRRG